MLQPLSDSSGEDPEPQEKKQREYSKANAINAHDSSDPNEEMRPVNIGECTHLPRTNLRDGN